MKRKIILCLFGLALGVIITFSVMPAGTTSALTVFYRQSFWHWIVYPPISVNHKLITVRQAAHVYEYFFLGICSGFLIIRKKKRFLTNVFAIAVCIAISNIDQLSKMFLPGREYDPKDLFFDAVGYVVALILVNMIEILYHVIVDKRKEKSIDHCYHNK